MQQPVSTRRTRAAPKQRKPLAPIQPNKTKSKSAKKGRKGVAREAAATVHESGEKSIRYSLGGQVLVDERPISLDDMELPLSPIQHIPSSALNSDLPEEVQAPESNPANALVDYSDSIEDMDFPSLPDSASRKGASPKTIQNGLSGARSDSPEPQDLFGLIASYKTLRPIQEKAATPKPAPARPSYSAEAQERESSDSLDSFDFLQAPGYIAPEPVAPAPARKTASRKTAKKTTRTTRPRRSVYQDVSSEAR
ncbi:hypothetical protein HDU91_002188 [Kappamyces sp. JEL0680]|nr:hypothetical protein HDU91_002188 [Kappamyces sp. JEL0680]